MGGCEVIMNFGLLLRTVLHLKPRQIVFQIKNRLTRVQYVSLPAPKVKGCLFKTEPVPREHCLDGTVFTFLNLSHEFAGWKYNEYGNLWTYNQNYFDWLNQEGITIQEGCKWIDRFIVEVLNSPIQPCMALDPYPIALRSINWIKFFCRFPDCATKSRLDALYSQVRLLEKKLEYHLLANHLLEDAYALYIGAAYFGVEQLLNSARQLLLVQLKEQVLPDGAHFEQSPMYHCILLDRLLDCINLGESMGIDGKQLRRYASSMLSHLEAIIWSDGSIPLLNDAAYGISPTPTQLFDYARRLGLQWKAIQLKKCGYRVLRGEKMEARVDVGNVTASYQPGHSHADSLNYELRVDGKPFVVDTGVSTYEKNERRQLERSSLAHNVVVVSGKDSSEVWGGFRVGRRCHTTITNSSEHAIEAWHNGFPKPCKRRFEMSGNSFVVEDWYEGKAMSYIHLAEGVDSSRIQVEGASSVDIRPWRYSTEYNRFHEGRVLEIQFNKHLKYTIQ